MTKFSVLLSVYKNEKPSFLIEALNSILKIQSILPNQVVIVKDGVLNEDLDEVLMSFYDSFPTILEIVGYGKNQGLGYALNYGLKYCKNEIVFRMDTDDISLPFRFEKQINLFVLNPKLAIIGSSINEFNIYPGDLNRLRTPPLTSEKIQKTLLKRNPFNHMTVGFKKSAVMEAGGYKEMPGYEDYYLWVRMLKTYNGINLLEPLVHARTGNDMIARRQGLAFFKKELAFQNRLLFEGYQNLFTWLLNLIQRAPVRLLPKKILVSFYNKILRTKL